MENKEGKYRVKDGIGAFFGLLRYIFGKSRVIYLAGIPFILATVLVGAVQVYLPKVVLAALETGKSVGYLGMRLLTLAALLLLGLLLSAKLTVKIDTFNALLRHEMLMEYAHKLLHVNYEHLENREFHVHRNRAQTAIYGCWGEGREIPPMNMVITVLYGALAALGSVLVYSVTVGRLSLILTMVILLTGIAETFVSSQAGKKYQKVADMASDVWGKENYITKRSGEFTMAKDIRLYQMKGWLLSQIAKYAGIRLKYKKKEMFYDGAIQLISAAVVGIQNICIYAYLIYGALKGRVTISDLVLYAGAASSLSQALYDLSGKIIDLHRISINYGRFRNFINYGQDMEETAPAIKKENVEIRLSHVSFRFPGEEENLLNDVNLIVRSGENLAIVGVNGAGKTTLMKLICGLLTPTEGTITINGKNIETLPPEERYSYFSCAFQDISFLPLSVRENISMCSKKESDEERIWSCLEMAGMKERITELPDKLDSLMEKDINEGAVDFSGGERQKLILARALYRGGSVLILDEPTAALDPISENDIYMRYAAFSEGKTSFFVSHRLSSTRFCDRIILLSKGRIEEEGTHEALLKKGGLYAEMFEMQSHYYKEENGAEPGKMTGDPGQENREDRSMGGESTEGGLTYGEA